MTWTWTWTWINCKHYYRNLFLLWLFQLLSRDFKITLKHEKNPIDWQLYFYIGIQWFYWICADLKWCCERQIHVRRLPYVWGINTIFNYYLPSWLERSDSLSLVITLKVGWFSFTVLIISERERKKTFMNVMRDSSYHYW